VGAGTDVDGSPRSAVVGTGLAPAHPLPDGRPAVRRSFGEPNRRPTQSLRGSRRKSTWTLHS